METNSYIKQYPDLMAGKKIMYVHGFASSAQSGTVKRLRTMFPQTTIIAEDIPVHPAEGFAMLSELAQREQPDLIIGTSMGGMYTEMLYGFDRILINPAFRIADTMGAHGMTGKQVFQNPRKDGVQEFLVTKSMVKEYHDMQEKCFSQAEDPKRVWGLFGDQDPLVHTMPVFMEHYTQGIWFHGEHRTNDHVFMNSVVPVIRWIDDKQEGRVRPVVFITIDALRNPQHEQRPSAMKAFRMLLESYNVYIVAPSPNYDADYVKDVQQWTDDIVNVPAYGHLVFTNQPELLMGDYLIGTDDVEGFMGATIRLGSETFKTWDDIIVYFSRLGGQ
jgi:predicted esterase YcpF (UPF0227 family)